MKSISKSKLYLLTAFICLVFMLAACGSDSAATIAKQ